MPELLKGRALKWFIANNKEWRSWAQFKESFPTHFLPRDFFIRLADQVRQGKQGFSESFKDYLIDIKILSINKENCTPSLRIFLRAYKTSVLVSLMLLADVYEELEKEREAFAEENKFSRTKSAVTTQVKCGRGEESGNQNKRENDQWSPSHQV